MEDKEEREKKIMRERRQLVLMSGGIPVSQKYSTSACSVLDFAWKLLGGVGQIP